MYLCVCEKEAPGMEKKAREGAGRAYGVEVETLDQLEAIAKDLILNGYDPQIFGHAISLETGREYSFWKTPKELADTDKDLKALDKELYFFRKEMR
jgi:hypothetical protein